MDVSFIIVNYRSRGLTLNCLQALMQSDWRGLSWEVIVVDNASNDNSAAIIRWQYPQIKLIESPINLGMGGGNNLGIAKASGRYVCVMNPDTLVYPDTVNLLIDFLDQHPDVGMVGPKQYNPDHSLQESCFRWHSPLTPLFRRTFLGQTTIGRRDLQRFLMNDFDKLSTVDVDWLLGSFLLMRRQALSQVGGFDERFFLYFEDTDLCRRFHDAGWRVVFCHRAEIIHNHNRASAQTPWYRFFTSASTRIHVASWLKYLLKWGVGKPKFEKTI